jgi:hypothetical protein
VAGALYRPSRDNVQRYWTLNGSRHCDGFQYISPVLLIHRFGCFDKDIQRTRLADDLFGSISNAEKVSPNQPF